MIFWQCSPGMPEKRDINFRIASFPMPWFSPEPASATWGPWPALPNYAWANRQIMMHRAREVIMQTLGISPRTLHMQLLYDVCHNIAKKEEHEVGGRKRVAVCPSQGGDTIFSAGTSFSAGGIPVSTGQPILIPGDMGTCISISWPGPKRPCRKPSGPPVTEQDGVLSRNSGQEGQPGPGDS